MHINKHNMFGFNVIINKNMRNDADDLIYTS